ncbi:hypothetical protein SLEP1_g2981 [Rubroshorea leprosula]|uniref:Uncharacterized protein n=1 Tax=Rubroshorea leprosula TaxID=152421 RepID=A0AAV5HSL2_9ROSI|nr:hypothetical protein SLEP1_g2981 [Rubroshorea leprosula]
MVDLEMNLQMVFKEIVTSLEEHSASALLRVPRATRNVLHLRDDAVSFRNSVAGILDKLKKEEIVVEGTTKDVAHDFMAIEPSSSFTPRPSPFSSRIFPLELASSPLCTEPVPPALRPYFRQSYPCTFEPHFQQSYPPYTPAPYFLHSYAPLHASCTPLFCIVPYPLHAYTPALAACALAVAPILRPCTAAPPIPGLCTPTCYSPVLASLTEEIAHTRQNRHHQ